MRFEDRKAVADIDVGHAVIVAYDPENQQMSWCQGPYLVPPHLKIADATVVRNELESQPGPIPVHRLVLLCEGRRWTAHPTANTRIHLLAAHHPKCGQCGELWPCRDERLDTEALRFTREMDYSCAHCGRRLGGSWYESHNDGLTTRRYHLAKKYRGPDGKPCRVALAEAKAQMPGAEAG